MRMFVTGINKQFLVHFTAKAVFRKHAFYSSFHYHFGAALNKILRCFFFFTTRVTGVVNVLFVVKFITREKNLFSIDNNYIIATIYVWCIIRFVLATKNRGDFGANATNGLISTVYNVPVTFYGSLVRTFGCEM